MSNLLKKIAQLESQLSELKLAVNSKSKESTKSSKGPKTKASKERPSSIEKCKKKAELNKFTKKELIEWMKEKRVAIKNASSEYKADLVKFVWKNIQKCSECSDEPSDESSDESSDETDSDDE